MTYAIITELFERLEEAKMDKQDIVKLINDIIKDTISNPVDFFCDLRNKKYDYALKNEICPKCGEKLIVRIYKERHPYGDTYAEEEIGELYCESCDIVY